jgi:cytochrome P450
MSDYAAAAQGDVFEDGVQDVYQRVATIHDRPGVPRDPEAGTVTFTRMADVVAVTKRRDVHSMDPDTVEFAAHFMGAGRPLIPLMLDGELHTKYRKLLDPLFAPKAVAALEPRVRKLCNDLIDGFAADGEVELFHTFCEPLPSQIFLTLLGLPLDDLPFLLWFKDGIIRPTDDDHRAAASPKMIEYLYAELDRREAAGEPGDDLIGGFITADVDGHRLTREDVIDITFLLVLAGLDTVSASLSCMIDWLARHPAERDALAADPSLLPTAIEELMRVQTPVVAGGRYAVADFELGGVEVRAGDNLRVLWSAANLDPTVFPEPTKVDFGREGNRHIAFASGFHRCLGSHLARLELRIALDTFHDRIRNYRPHPDRAPGYLNSAIRVVDPLPLVFDPA